MYLVRSDQIRLELGLLSLQSLRFTSTHNQYSKWALEQVPKLH